MLRNSGTSSGRGLAHSDEAAGQIRDRHRPLRQSGGQEGNADVVVSDGEPKGRPLSPTNVRGRLLAWLLIFHWLLAGTTVTYFQPDETWQSVEVAHRIVYGYGHLTWEWRQGGHLAGVARVAAAESISEGVRRLLETLAQGPIRSVIHPLLFVPVFWLLRLTDLDRHFLALTLAPRLLQATLSAIGSYYTTLLAEVLVGAEGAWATIFSLLLSPYYLYTSTRTFSNTAEAAFSSTALYYVVLAPRTAVRGEQRRRLATSLCLAAGACLLRPTNGIVWLFQYGSTVISLLRKSPSRLAARSTTRFAFVVAAAIGLAAITLSAVADSIFNNFPSLPAIPFVLQNILRSVSIFYGTHPWHWYLTQGLPVIGMTSLPFMLLGSYRMISNSDAQKRQIVCLIAWTIGTLSLLSHKEWRFLQPIVPLLHVCAGHGLIAKRQATRSRSNSVVKAIWHSVNGGRRALLLSTLPIAVYLLAFHSVAQSLTLPMYIRGETRSGRLRSLGMLMPCHSTPWQSHLHLPELELQGIRGKENGSGNGGYLWFLTCDPPGALDNAASYKDQSDFFYDDPLAYLTSYFPSTADVAFPSSRGWTQGRDASTFGTAASHDPPHQWPSHIAVFEALLKHPRYGDAVSEQLRLQGYSEAKRMWNSLFHDDARRTGAIVVFAHRALS